jgi:hypothetical protein
MGVFLAAMVSCLVAYPGCESPAEQAQPDQPPPAIAQFAVSFERGGGLKADPRSLEIAPGRNATAKGLGRTVHFRVGVKPVRRLRKALEGAGFADIPDPRPSNCADCFYYDIEYRGHEVEFSQLDQPRKLVGVVDQLEALIDSHLPFH